MTNTVSRIRGWIEPHKTELSLFGLWFAVEVLLSLLIAAAQPARLRTALLTGGDVGFHVLGSFAWVWFRVFFLYVLAATWCVWGRSALRLKSGTLVPLGLLTYAILYNAIHNPQIFDEWSLGIDWFAPINWIAEMGEPWMLDVLLITSLAMAWGLSHWNQLARMQTQRTSLVSSFLWVTFTLSFHFVLQNPWPEIDTRPNPDLRAQSRLDKGFNSPSAQPARRAIILSVDSLRPDAEWEANENSGLRKFLNESAHLRDVISPIGQTHAAMLSIFTAKNPSRHGARHILAESAADVSRWYQESAVQLARESGIELHTLFDSNEYHHFLPTHHFDSQEGPPAGFSSLLLPVMFRDRLFFGLFNNKLGRWVLPETELNSSFSFAYKLAPLTQRVVEKIRELDARGRDYILYVHTCALHWPGDLPWPYYPRHAMRDGGAAFAYAPRMSGLSELQRPRNWQERIDYHREIYRRGLRMIEEKFLAPIFTYLQLAEHMGRSTIVLTSDHGEYLGSSSDFPRSKAPEHGASLLFASDSERTQAWIHGPKVKPGKVTGAVGLIDLMPTILDGFSISKRSNWDGESWMSVLTREGETRRFAMRPIYTETGMWPLSLFRGQAHYTPLSLMPDLFRYESEHQTFQIDANYESPIILQKQRAVYLGSKRWTLFPTEYGDRIVSCETIDDDQSTQVHDSSCEHVKSDSPQQAMDWISRFSQGDQEAHLAPRWRTSGSHRRSNLLFDQTLPVEIHRKWIENHGQYEWPLLRRARELGAAAGDFMNASRILDDLIAHPQTSIVVKRIARRDLMSWCAAGSFTQGSRPRYFSEFKTYQVPPSEHDLPGIFELQTGLPFDLQSMRTSAICAFRLHHEGLDQLVRESLRARSRRPVLTLEYLRTQDVADLELAQSVAESTQRGQIRELEHWTSLRELLARGDLTESAVTPDLHKQVEQEIERLYREVYDRLPRGLRLRLNQIQRWSDVEQEFAVPFRYGLVTETELYFELLARQSFRELEKLRSQARQNRQNVGALSRLETDYREANLRFWLETLWVREAPHGYRLPALRAFDSFFEANLGDPFGVSLIRLWVAKLPLEHVGRHLVRDLEDGLIADKVERYCQRNGGGACEAWSKAIASESSREVLRWKSFWRGLDQKFKDGRRVRPESALLEALQAPKR
ncbi:MAG TPA: sulfatase-like hydrolase/transferase [Pseudobdellovibrionaceae bacterium]|nr:sulfatase-like hydrolase/transferase [Pseudobdellovibrionaceae bacterium]